MCMASPSLLLRYGTFSLLYKGLVIIVGHRLPRPLQTSQVYHVCLQWQGIGLS